MKFVSDGHKQFFNDHSDITERGDDFAALIYTLGISPTCREHFDRLYNPAERSIISAGLNEGWQTGASKRITRLAYNLFTWHTIDGDDPEQYTPKSLFSSLDDTHRTGALYAIMYYA